MSLFASADQNFFLKKINKSKMTSFVKITYLSLVWNKNGLVIVFIIKLIFCYMIVNLTGRINCTVSRDISMLFLRCIALHWNLDGLCISEVFSSSTKLQGYPTVLEAATGDEERDDSLTSN